MADDESGRPSREDATGRDRDGDASAPSDDGDTVASGDTAPAGDGDTASTGAANDGTYTPPTAQEGISAQQAPATGNGQAGPAGTAPAGDTDQRDVPADVRKYDRFKKMDGAQYERVNQFLRDRTYITAREWAIARLCSDFRTETGVEMTKIGENLPELVPFMTDTYTPQAVNQARASFKDKVSKSGATFLYGAMSDFFTAEELDDMMYEVTEVAKFLLEVEGADLSVDEELEAEERISSVMRDVRQASADLRNGDEVTHSHDDEGHTCPNCGHEFEE
ncbi:DUF5806 family protein [Halobacteriaceae archaeon GCM10025711]